MAERNSRKNRDYSRQLTQLGWYHSFSFPDGTTIQGVQSLAHQVARYQSFGLPADLRGKRVLDIGSWDGWFAFEAERHGADVTAVDCVEMENFLHAQRKLGSKVEYRILDVYELTSSGIGQFDYVLFLGVLYHLKHPLLALEMVCSLAAEAAIIESFVTDGEDWESRQNEIPQMVFYETDELGGHLDNWYGPSVACLTGLCRAAGFAQVEIQRADKDTALVVCRRRWENLAPPPGAPAAELLAVAHSRNYGINVSAKREDYLTWWFRCQDLQLSASEVFPEVGGLGVPVIYLRFLGNGEWQANTRVPPGLSPGWKSAHLRTLNSGYSAAQRVAVDMAVAAPGPPEVTGLCDATDWTPGVVRLTGGGSGYLSMWLRGLTDNADRNNVAVYLSETRMKIDFVGELDQAGTRQLNMIVPATVGCGEHPATVGFGGFLSKSATCSVVA